MPSNELRFLIDAYNFFVKGIDAKAKDGAERAYGGIIRAGKGKIVESMARRLVELAWEELGEPNKRLSFEREHIKIPLKEDYLKRIKNPDIRSHVEKNIRAFHYSLATDIHVNIDGKFAMAIECKAYTENAMFKRILVDFTLLRQEIPNLTCLLFQLESQLGGDYSKVAGTIFGSPSTHTLLSHFDVDLTIITLLEGERKVDKPIHKSPHYKPLKRENILAALEVLKGLLSECARQT